MDTTLEWRWASVSALRQLLLSQTCRKDRLGHRRRHWASTESHGNAGTLPQMPDKQAQRQASSDSVVAWEGQGKAEWGGQGWG